MRRPGGRALSLAVNADGAVRVASAEKDAVRVLNGLTGDTISLMKNNSEVRSAALSVSADGGRVVSATSRGAITVWEAETGRIIARMESPPGPQEVFFSPDSDRVGSVSAGDEVRVCRRKAIIG